MPTIADVARAAGVSIATVSRVLSPGPMPHPVRADTAERVREAARQLNFVPSPLARGLAARRSGLIGLVVPDLADPHYPHIAIGVEERARAWEMGVLICNTLGDIDRLSDYLQLLQARRVDFIVLSGATSLNPDELHALERSEVPMVLIGRPVIDMPWPHVSSDNRLGARLATRRLLELGRLRVVHLGGPQSQTTMADRARGYLDAMAQEIAQLPGEIVVSNGTPEDGYARLRARFESSGAARFESPAADRPETSASARFESPAGSRLETSAGASFESLAEARLERPAGAPFEPPAGAQRETSAGARSKSSAGVPDAVFAATDRLALAALAVAADLSLHVPGDLAVIGFDDMPLAAQLRPSLSSVSQPAHELGVLAVELAQRLAAGQRVEAEVLPPRLIERESTLGPGGRFTR